MAAYALMESGDPAAGAAMDAALTDPAWQVRVSAVEYHARLTPFTPSDRLRDRLTDRHLAVRSAAERILSH
jgi:hypothetical protein